MLIVEPDVAFDGAAQVFAGLETIHRQPVGNPTIEAFDLNKKDGSTAPVAGYISTNIDPTSNTISLPASIRSIISPVSRFSIRQAGC